MRELLGAPLGHRLGVLVGNRLEVLVTIIRALMREHLEAQVVAGTLKPVQVGQVVPPLIGRLPVKRRGPGLATNPQLTDSMVIAPSTTNLVYYRSEI